MYEEIICLLYLLSHTYVWNITFGDINIPKLATSLRRSHIRCVAYILSFIH